MLHGARPLGVLLRCFPPPASGLWMDMDLVLVGNSIPTWHHSHTARPFPCPAVTLPEGTVGHASFTKAQP